MCLSHSSSTISNFRSGNYLLFEINMISLLSSFLAIILFKKNSEYSSLLDITVTIYFNEVQHDLFHSTDLLLPTTMTHPTLCFLNSYHTLWKNLFFLYCTTLKNVGSIYSLTSNLFNFITLYINSNRSLNPIKNFDPVISLYLILSHIQDIKSYCLIQFVSASI